MAFPVLPECSGTPLPYPGSGVGKKRGTGPSLLLRSTLYLGQSGIKHCKTTVACAAAVSLWPWHPAGTMKAERLHDSMATVRTQIEDLQAEVEAGARCADRIHTDVKIIDDRVMNHFRQAGRMTALLESAEELKKSIRDQRRILRGLRQSVDLVRQSIRGNKK